MTSFDSPQELVTLDLASLDDGFRAYLDRLDRLALQHDPDRDYCKSVAAELLARPEIAGRAA